MIGAFTLSRYIAKLFLVAILTTLADLLATHLHDRILELLRVAGKCGIGAERDARRHRADAPAVPTLNS